MSAPQKAQLDSPRRFLRLVRQTEPNHHRLFAERMVSAGFEVRRVVRRSYHGAWGVYLRRGTVPPGQEIDRAKDTVMDALKGLGKKCLRKEVGCWAKGDRVEAFFIFEAGVPGTLSYYRGREEWVREPIETWPEPLE